MSSNVSPIEALAVFTRRKHAGEDAYEVSVAAPMTVTVSIDKLPSVLEALGLDQEGLLQTRLRTLGNGQKEEAKASTTAAQLSHLGFHFPA